MRLKPKWIALIVLALVIVVSTVVILGRQERKEVKKPLKPKPVAKQAVIPPAAEATTPCSLDGIKTSPELASRRPLAVMVENLVSVRPQAGLSQACLVVEGLAEGGITRLMGVYGHQEAENIGPVRSARSHFVAIARGLDALYAHAGGSKYAMAAIKNWGVADLDEFRYSSAYRRITSAKMPHNLFTSTNALRGIKGDAGGSYHFFSFKEEPPLESRPEKQKVVINFSSSAYLVEYQYQKRTNSYLRFNGGSPHKDANTGQQLEAKNIVVVYTPTSPIAGGSGILDVNLLGSGRLMVIRDGVVINGIWQKSSIQSPLLLKDNTGAEIPLTPGQIWLEVVATNTPVIVE